jgi:G6PDH family F420-dependent oxidoreductase
MSKPRIRLGWWLSSEEHDPRDLVSHAQLAESVGFDTAMISDHLQPWVRHQGNSAFVWPVIGAIATATDRLQIGTGVTAMVHRNHPITVAQAAATAAVMSEDRFFLGVGIGERLNEQTFGERWPRSGERRPQLEEAVEVIRLLFSGALVNHHGEFWSVENLRLTTRPASPPSIYMAAGGKLSAASAGKVGDGMIGVTADAHMVNTFHGSGGTGKPCLAQLHVSIAASMDEALDNAWEWWPQGVVPPNVFGELAKPEEFESLATAVGREGITDVVVCATDGARIIDAIDKFVGAGFDTVYVHQVGRDQQRLADLASAELIDQYRCSG